MKVLVTGATGHVGKHLVPALLAKGHSVRVAVLDAEEAREAFKDAPLEIMELDFAIAEQSAFDTIAKGVDAVVHLAAVGVINPDENKKKIFAVNVEATKKLLNACKRNARFNRFVFISSSALFHKPSRLPIEENDAPSPGNAYGESKLTAEKAVRESGVPFVILRPVVIYGLGFEPSFAPAVKAIQKGKMPVIGEGNTHFPVVHVDDFVNAVLLSLEKDAAKGETFNISGEALTQKQWTAAVANELGVQPPKTSIPVWLAEAMALFYELKAKLFGGKTAISRESVRRLTTDRVFSTKKAERLLGWKAKVKPQDGLSEMIASIFG
ncbi:MAG: NAD-dependent epimerase/dehydratase family protein [Candidatus Norongarragalinales archaeon]